MWPQLPSCHPSPPLFIWGGGQRRRAEPPHPVQERPEGPNVVIQPWTAQEFFKKAEE